MKPYLFFFLTFLCYQINGTTQSCGTTFDATSYHFDQKQFKQWKQEQLAKGGNNEVIRVGITIHVVEAVTGAANISLARLYEELDLVNDYFTSTGIEFFYCGSPRYVTGREIYTKEEVRVELNAGRHIENTINIFYLDEIGNAELSDAACGISSLPFITSTPRERFILMEKECSTNGTVLAHEIGHFFGLLHTHETAVGVELVERTNCETTGDLLCDTNADPNLSRGGLLNGCTYIGELTDPNGDLYAPPVSNIMAYSPSACQRRFSEGQKNRMLFYYDTELNYLVSDCDDFPDFALASDQGKLTIGTGQQVDIPVDFTREGTGERQEVELIVRLTQESDNLTFTVYRETLVFETGINNIEKDISFDFPEERGSGAYNLTVILDPNGTYLERDKRNNIYEIDLTVDNSVFQDLVFFPNPATEELNIFIRNRNVSGKVSLTVYDFLGRVYLQDEGFKSGEEFFTGLDISSLPQGWYVVSVGFETGNNQENFTFLKTEN